MAENKQDVSVKNVDYKNKTITKPRPSSAGSADTTKQLQKEIVELIDANSLDMSKLESFTSVSRARNDIYNLLDMMGEDSTISSALDIYASDACDTNDKGQIIWCESNDSNVSSAVSAILDKFEIDKHAFDNVYSLCKYGDVYLQLYRNSEYNEDQSTKTLNEDIILKAYSKNDRYSGYIEQVENPAEIFELTKYGKSYGFLRTELPKNVNSDDILTSNNFTYNYNFNTNDVQIYPATEFVHASLADKSCRTSEEVVLSNGEDSKVSTYKVRRGQSILYNSFKVWRELTLLENSVLLNRLTKSGVTRAISVEVGDMEKNQARALLQRVKTSIEQKSGLNIGNSLQEYTNPGPMENTIYIPTHNGVGAISTSQIGGDVQVGDLNDLDYWKKKLFASLGIPGQYLGDTDDNTGFNGGTSLSLISSRYAKTIKHIQNAYLQAITDAVNLVLLDSGLHEYINQFTLKMQAPFTQEEKDRKDNISNSINNIQSIMGLLPAEVEPQSQLEILTSLLSSVITDQDVISILQENITSQDNTEEEEFEDDEEDFESNLPTSDKLDLDDFEGSSELNEPSKESSNEPEENDDDNLPSFDDMGLDFNSEE